MGQPRSYLTGCIPEPGKALLWEVDMGCAQESFQSRLGILGPLKGKEFTQIYRYCRWKLMERVSWGPWPILVTFLLL